MLLDLNIIDEQVRLELVKSTLSQKKEFTHQDLKNLSDYLLFVGDKKQTIKQRNEEYPIITTNREATISKRQISYDGLIDKFKNGEDGIYAIINNNKNQLLDYRDPISEEDLESIPELRECVESITVLQRQYDRETSISRRKKLKTTIIDSWKQAYLIKSFHHPERTIPGNNILTSLETLAIPEKIYFDEKFIPHSNQPFSFLNLDTISFMLQYYQSLKEETWHMINSDIKWHLFDFEKIVDDALEDNYPILYDVLIWKIDGLTNKEIKDKIFEKYGENHSEQYYSTVWTKKIPKLIMEQAQKNYLLWYFTYEEPTGYRWKKCGKCKRSLLAHPIFFSPNSSKDGFYSICKDCRRKKGGKKNGRK